MREISTCGISPDMTKKLLQKGFRTCHDCLALTPEELSKNLEITLTEALLLLQTIHPSSRSNNNNDHPEWQAKTALDFVQNCIFIPTLVPDLDELLQGGVHCGEITEFCGVAGIGKTQLGMQLALNAQLDFQSHSIAYQSIYIDTEGSFMIKRVAQMASYLVNDFKNLSSAKCLMDGIHYYRVYDYQQFQQIMKSIALFLEKHSNIRIIVIDSIAFHMRHEFEDMGLRSRILTVLSLELHHLAEEYNVAVVLLNQVTTKLVQDENSSILKPALGESWYSSVTHRILLQWKRGLREARVIKSPSIAPSSVNFYINEKGIQTLNQRKREYSLLLE